MHKFRKLFKFIAVLACSAVFFSATAVLSAEEFYDNEQIKLLASESTDDAGKINALKSLILNSKPYYELDYDVYEYCKLKNQVIQGNPAVTEVTSETTTEPPAETTVPETTEEPAETTTARQPKPDVSYNTFGIDVSVHQGTIDWNAVKNDGVDFAVLRAGYGNLKSQIDKSFEKNYAACKKYGIPVGAYWYSYAKTVADAEREAEVFLYALKGKTFEYPVYFDIEDRSQQNLNRQLVTDMTEAFCARLESAGYYVGIYTNVYWTENILYQAQLTDYDKWLAHWVARPKYGNSFGGMWQFGAYGSQAQVNNGQATMYGEINGISAACDVNVCYRNYPDIIKSNNLNGY